MEDMVIGILGFGKLAPLLTEHLIRVGVKPENIRVVVRSDVSRERAQRFGVCVVPAEELGGVDMVIIAVKYDQFEEAWKSIRVEGNPVMLSCMAKGTIAELEKITGSQRVARLMTSTPCCIGKGVGAWLMGASATGEDKKFVQKFAAVFGTHVEADSEREIAFATTLSSINGLVYLIIQWLREAMVHIGAPAKYVDLVVPTIESAIALHRHRPGVHLVQLADDVTSPDGGTGVMRFVAYTRAMSATIIECVRETFKKYTS